MDDWRRQISKREEETRDIVGKAGELVSGKLRENFQDVGTEDSVSAAKTLTQ